MMNSPFSSESENAVLPIRVTARETIIPNDLVLEVQRIDHLLLHLSDNPIRKIAVFDLDNTLLVGDIGEAVFAQLIADGYDLPISWLDYQQLVQTNTAEAYETIVKAMRGLSVGTVVKATHRVLFSTSAEIHVPGGSVAIPYAHPVLHAFVHYLRKLQYELYVLTASNEISARIATSLLFEIPETNVFGIRLRIDHDLLTDQLVSPPPIENRKVEVYHRYIGSAAPFITAGDNFLDIPLLRFTNSQGLSIWVGEDRIGFQVAKTMIAPNHRFYFLSRTNKLHFKEEGANI